MVTLPYVKKRIKQNLRGISFEDDSDEDKEWSRSRSKERRGSRGGKEQDLARKVLPQRSRRKLVDLISSESSEED